MSVQGGIIPTVAPLTSDEAKAKLNRCLSAGSTEYSLHFGKRLRDRDLSTVDILRICRSGAVLRPPEFGVGSGDWKYTIEGRNVDGIHVAVVFAFTGERAVFITVIKEGSR